MKKLLALSVLLIAALCCNAQQVEHNTRAYSIVNLDPILETEEGQNSLVITPQIVRYYDCDGNVENTIKQYEITYYCKVMGMVATTCTYTISGKTLCLLKVMAQKTLGCMNNGGTEGFVIDNGLAGNAKFTLTVSEFKPQLAKKGWYMSIYTGVYNQYTNGYVILNRKITSEFVKALSSIETE